MTMGTAGIEKSRAVASPCKRAAPRCPLVSGRKAASHFLQVPAAQIHTLIHAPISCMTLPAMGTPKLYGSCHLNPAQTFMHIISETPHNSCVYILNITDMTIHLVF